MLFISPRNSTAAQLNLFDLTGCTKILTTSPQPPAISQLVSECKLPLFIVPSVDELLSTDHPYYLYDKTFDEAKDEPFVALHTSGSTGTSAPHYSFQEELIET